MQIRRNLQEQLGAPQSLRDVVVSLYKMATICVGEKQLDWARQALAVAEDLAMKFPGYPHQVLELAREYCDGLGKNGEGV